MKDKKNVKLLNVKIFMVLQTISFSNMDYLSLKIKVATMVF